MRVGAWLLLAHAASVGAPAHAQSDSQVPTVSKECGEIAAADTPLPHGATALRERKQLRILAIGASSASMLGGTRDSMPLLEQILERSIKGLDVEIINRGVSGELAAAAAERLKIEVALNHPDVILWQVGTNDAFAQVPVEEFETTVREMLQWLKKHNVDAILIGLHYMKQLARHEHYQAIRASLRRIVAAEGVLRIGRYESSEILARTLKQEGHFEASTFGLNEGGYNCMAQYLARAIAVGLFAKRPIDRAP
jgi:acyl-CoA thioesterase I